jgi:hypothetical protein
MLPPFHLMSPRNVIATDNKPYERKMATHPNSLRLGGTVKRMLAAVFQSAPLLQSKFWTCLYASIRARAAASARAFAAVAAAASASTGVTPSPAAEERRRRRDETGSRRPGRSAGSIASSRVVGRRGQESFGLRGIALDSPLALFWGG